MEQTVDTPMKGDSRQEDDGFQSDTPVDQIMDAAERRRMQNRTAQRNHRSRCKPNATQNKPLIWTQPNTIPQPPSRVGGQKQQKPQRQQQNAPNQRSQAKSVSNPSPKEQTQLPFEIGAITPGGDDMQWINGLSGDDFMFDLLSDDAFLGPVHLIDEASGKDLTDFLDASKEMSTMVCEMKGADEGGAWAGNHVPDRGGDDGKDGDSEDDSGSGDTEEDFSGYNALHLAASIGQVGTVRLLLQLRPADVDRAAEGGQRHAPLHIASAHHHIDVVRVLLDHGAKVRLQDGLGCTPLHVAVRAGAHAITRLLVCWCVEVLHIRDAAGRTPLHDAIIKGDEETVRLLLDYGADPAAVVAQDALRT